MSNFQQVKLILKIACFCLFLGRGWQHFFWDIPLRSFFWNEALLAPLVESLTPWTWQQYVSSTVFDSFINLISKLIGLFYLVMAAVMWRLPERFNYLFKLASGLLALMAFLYFMAKFFYVGMLIEHASQVMMPYFYYLVLQGEDKWREKLAWVKIAAAMTFVGHAFFAIGIHPVPGPFIDMLINVFGVSDAMALGILRLAGSLDIAAALFLFIPHLQLPALVFMVFWGLTTAFARMVAHFDEQVLWASVHQWLAETVYRIPHGFIPLALLISLKPEIFSRFIAKRQ